jgi:hypothetical protein
MQKPHDMPNDRDGRCYATWLSRVVEMAEEKLETIRKNGHPSNDE